jgi:GTPase SAR1 family protein/gas vesicle protein
MTGQITQQPQTPASSAIDMARSVAKLGLDATTAYDRPDLGERMQGALARLSRPDTIVCVVGEFKQGKSSLVNALVGDQICPVDDDLATSAITVLRYNETPSVRVRRTEDNQVVTQEIEFHEIEQFASERGNRENQRRVEVIEVGVPNRLLEAGVTLVDTPGAGGIISGYAAATLGFLQTADALLFVSDASAELSAPEIDFLRQAQQKCPVVLVVQSKIDLYPAWQRILTINRGHLAREGIDAHIVPVSSVIRTIALQRQSRDLNTESGFPFLLDALKTEVLDRAQITAARRALADTRNAAQQMATSYSAELSVLENPESAQETLRTLEAAKEKLNHLRGPAARWSVVLNDGFAVIASQVDYQFRSSMRSLLRTVEEEIEETDPASKWDEIGTQLRTDVAQAVDETFNRLTDDTTELRDTIVALLQDEFAELNAVQNADLQIDVLAMWTEREIETESISGKFFQGLNALRGSYMGLLMVGMLGNVIGIAMVGPLLLGAGLLFGGRHIMEERKKQITKRRQQARTFVRQFIDDVQFEVGTRIREATRDLQRELRDYFTDRLNELMRTYAEAAQATQQSLQQDQATRDRRITDLRSRVEKLNELQRRVDVAEAQL